MDGWKTLKAVWTLTQLKHIANEKKRSKQKCTKQAVSPPDPANLHPLEATCSSPGEEP